MTHHETSNDPSRDTLTCDISETMWFLGVSRSTLYRMMADGAIPSFKIRGSRRFRLIDLERYVRGQVGS